MFISRKHILDASMVANEIIEDLKHRKEKVLVFKLNFEKAYDRVNWGCELRVLVKAGGCELRVVFSLFLSL